ncbi:hypothetical protein [Nocardioides sp. YIM 152588]|uniref:hypothetical protein n=1 Tax=Nocardioides sp. YIM 152588 TaxID=3158259 RepID=UPI0032E3DE85
MVDLTVPGGHRTSDLVHAAASALGAAGGRRVAIAVGASRRTPPDDPAADPAAGPGTGPRIADRSALLRLRDVERMDRDQVREAIRSAPVEASPHGEEGVRSRLAAGLLGAGIRLLAPRLGSSLLVSHLGRVDGTGVDRLLFHPVTAGGSGLSLGAVVLGDTTTVTLRGRARTWNDDGLEQLLEAIVDRL